jgi:ribose 5-phosphate isomerase B|tara:strand:+ start:37 stop:486 length:450 start_codon:yes stop_codon:yes gene_type:complete
MKDNFILLGADHLGLPLKNALKEHLKKNGYEVEDIGVDNENPVDYPDVGEKLARRIANGDSERGILCCGTGAGMAIVANKIPGVRAVCINDPYTAERAIASNNAQVVTLGSLIIGPEVGKKLVDVWLENDFQGGKSLPKVQKINKLDLK